MALINSNGTGGGLSNATASWAGGVVPVDGDQVTIVAGDTIELNDTHVWGDDSATAININGILKASRTVSSSLTCKGDLLVLATGTLDRGKESDPIPQAYTADLHLNYSAAMADGKWGLRTSSGASLFMWGYTKTRNTEATATIAIAATVFDVVDAMGWAVGDKLVIAATDNAPNETDICTISNVSGNTITVSAGLTYAHNAPATPIGNFTSNVTTKAHTPANESFARLYTNADNPDGMSIGYVTFEDIGDSSNTQKYGVQLEHSSFSSKTWDKFESVAFWSDGSADYCLGLYNFVDDLIMKNLAFYNPGRTGAYIRQGAIITIDDSVFYQHRLTISSSWSHGGVNCVLNRCKFFSASTIFSLSSAQGFQLNDCEFYNSTTVFSVAFGAGHSLNSCIFGNDTWGQVDYCFHTNTNALTSVLATDCVFATPKIAFTLYIYNANPAFEMWIANKNVDPSQQEYHTPNGVAYRDNATFKSGVASLRMEPISATNPLSFSLDVFAPDSLPVVVTGFLRKDSSYGAAMPTVTLSGLGITPDTWTMTDVDDTWVQFKVAGQNTSGTDGVLTLEIAAQSTAGSAWVDGIAVGVPAAINLGDFGYWAGGLPSKGMLANFVSAIDVWNVPADQALLAGSMGESISLAKKWVGWLRSLL